MNAHGLTFDITKGQGEDRTVEKIWVAAAFEVLGRIRDPNGEGWARWLRWRDEDGRVHTQPISDADLHGDPRALCAMLAGLGLKVATGPNRGKLLRYLNEASVQSRVTIVPRTGWHEVGDTRVFALPDETFGSAKRPSSSRARRRRRSRRVDHSRIGRTAWDRWLLDTRAAYLRSRLHSLVHCWGSSGWKVVGFIFAVNQAAANPQ